MLFVFLFLNRGLLVVSPRLSLHLGSSCLCRPSAEITGVCGELQTYLSLGLGKGGSVVQVFGVQTRGPEFGFPEPM